MGVSGVGVVLAAYGVASVVAFAAYGLDKRRARRGGRRIPEATLHGLEAVGGWPGALLGGRVFRHKTVKGGFRVVRALIVLAHLAGWGWWLATRGG